MIDRRISMTCTAAKRRRKNQLMSSPSLSMRLQWYLLSNPGLKCSCVKASTKWELKETCL